MGKLKVGVIFGGKSGEHEVSIKSAYSVIKALLNNGYTIVPMGIDKQGFWHVRSDAMSTLLLKAQADLLGTFPHNDLDYLENWIASDTENEQVIAQELFPPISVLKSLAVAFPVLHGPYGEDGTIQGLLEMADIPYVGCGVAASAIGMDKIIFKDLMRAHHVPTPRFLSTTRKQLDRGIDDFVKEIERKLTFPVFCKPANLGSSVGISRCQSMKEIKTALHEASLFDRRILVEEAVPFAREVEISVLGNEHPSVSIPGEIVPSRDFYDYKAKYIDSGDDASKLIIPAELTDKQVSFCQNLAVKVFKLIDGAGMARVDFLLNANNGEIYVNEINTIPGFTDISMYAKLWAASGISYASLLEKLIELAINRYDEKAKNKLSP